MKPAPFDYVRPQTIEEACTILAEAGGGATVIAGGQTLMPLLALRMSQPFILVDVGSIAELQGTSRMGDATRIGPMTRQNDLIADAMLARQLPVLVEAIRHVGHHQTRNRGTIGGSIVFGEPAAEAPAAALALGARLQVRSQRRERTVPAEEFYFGPYATALEPDELLTAIDFPGWPPGHLMVFREVVRRPGDFALVGLVGAMTLEDGRIGRAGLAWFGMGPTPVRMRSAEAALVGSDPAAVDLHALAEAALAEVQPFDDKQASAEYRRIVGRRIFIDTFSQALSARAAA